MSSLNALNIVLAAFISMSAVELLKDLTPLRYAFNRWAVQRWLWRGLDLHLHPGSQLWAILSGEWLGRESIFRPSTDAVQPSADKAEPSADNAESSADKAEPSADNAESSADKAEPLADNAESSADKAEPSADTAEKRYEGLERRVVELAACGQRAALYRPELAQIAGQLHLLAERLMDFPSQDPIVLRAIAGVPEVRPKGSRPQPDEDLKRLAELSGGFRAALAQAEASSSPSPYTAESATTTSAEAGALIDTRTRVTGWVQGRLNELQTTGRTSWRVVLLALAIGIGVAVIEVPGGGTYLDGVFAGLLAPIAYELLSMIKRVGRP